METVQKFSLPLAIVVAGAFVAGAVLYTKAPASQAQAGAGPSWTKQTIRGIVAGDHVRGSKDAKVVVVEFSDPECPFCRIFHTTMQQVVGDYGDKVTWVYRHFPLPQLHPKAQKESEALECAHTLGGDDAFWKYTDKLYATTKSNNSLDDGIYNTPSPTPVGQDGKPFYTEKKPRSTTDAGQLSDIASSVGLDKTAFETCLKDSTTAARVQTDVDEIVKIGGNGTPSSFILVGGKQMPIEGAQPIAAVKKMIDEALKR